MGGGELYGGVKRRVKKSSSSAKRVAAKPKREGVKPKREGVKRRNAFNRRLMGKFGGFLNELYVEGEGQSSSSTGGNSVERLVQQLTQQFQNNEMAGGKPRRKKSALSASPVKKVKKVKKVRRKTRGGDPEEVVTDTDATADKPVNAEGEAPADDKEGKDMGGGGYRKVKRVVRKVRSSSPSRKARPAAKARPVGKARPVRKARPTRRRSASPGRR
jgi:hypothetical protein